MKATDFSILDILDFKPDRGLIELANRRVIIFDGNILMELRQVIVESLGWEQCKLVVFRYGYQVGSMDAQNLGDAYEWDSTEEWFKAGAVMLTQRGYAKTVLNHFSYKSDENKLNFKGRWYNAYEIDSHKHLMLTDAGPVCYVNCGYLSGYASVCFGRDVLVQEQEQFQRVHCSFEGRFVEEWGKQGLRFMQANKDYDLRQKYARLNKKLSASRKKTIPEEKDDQIFEYFLQQKFKWLPHRSKDMHMVLKMAHQVAKTSSNVLITGETGVGKEVVANFIHTLSQNAPNKFLAINCTAIPITLLESELFGHIKGSFTGADSDKKGLLIEAGSGTIFLDEIGDIPPSVQVKLLRALEEKKVRPIGSHREQEIKARLIASTNRDLQQLIKDGKFRADLYYRLNVFPIFIPPLRDRRDDILPIARYFKSKFAPDSQGFSPRAAYLLENYDWPGNIRELSNAIERAGILAGKGKIKPEHLPPAIVNSGKTSFFCGPKGKESSLVDMEKKYILEVLNQCQGKKLKAAQKLGIGANTLWRKLKTYESQKIH